MGKLFKKITIYKFNLILYLFISINANAACEKEDINYYFLMIGGKSLHNKNVHARTTEYKIIKN